MNYGIVKCCEKNDYIEYLDCYNYFNGLVKRELFIVEY